MLDVNMFDQLKIGLATADQIRNWSHGEVKKPETINYRTLRPEKDGLFCEKIFGPTRDWECYCGKYKRVRFKGIICERCGVEVTRSKVRRDRMGHIELAAPVVHIWYLRGTRSWLAYLLAGIEPKEELKAKQLEKVIYFAANLVTWVDEDKRHEDLPNLEAEYLEERDAIQKEMELAIDRRYKELEDAAAEARPKAPRPPTSRRSRSDAEQGDRGASASATRSSSTSSPARGTSSGALHSRKIIDDEMLWRELRDQYGDYFEGGTGADAIKSLIDRIDFDEEEIKLREAIDPATSGRKPLSAQRKQKAIKRLKIVASFNRRDEHGRRINDPKAMILDVVPVIPPELRPMVQLDGGRFATSDLNDLYRRVINRNNRLKRLLDLGAPEIIVNNEKRMLQEAVDALFDNGRRGRPVTGPGNRPLKSLSDMLKGKQGRFRQNLLGKRVDYSGRSVIVAGPTLRLHQCGLPKLMALELFKPFVMKRLVDLELAQNIKTAKRMVERRRPQVWDVLEDVIKEHPVLLNRAPTLHRLGIQAFEPVLVEGKALQIHPLVCTAFNADFDGDQMAIHVPLSAEAQAEARVLMLSANNILSPASGRPIVTPQPGPRHRWRTTSPRASRVRKGEGRVFRHLWEVLRAYDEGALDLHAPITMRDVARQGAAFETTAGRLLFEEALPADYTERVRPHRRHGQEEGDGRHRRAPVRQLRQGRGRRVARRDQEPLLPLRVAVGAHGVDRRRQDAEGQAGAARRLRGAGRQGRDAVPPRHHHRRRAPPAGGAHLDRRHRRGAGGDGEAEFKAQRFNPIDMMVGSGARGNMTQMRQIAGMRGLVANPRGDMIPRPIKSNFREGLETLEYFIATPGARKGLVDTALRTADSGYLTRRLVDVAQELIVREDDCGTTLGVWVENVGPDTANRRTLPRDQAVRPGAAQRHHARRDGTVARRATPSSATRRWSRCATTRTIDRLRVRSVLTCDAELGVCALCYGRSLATGKTIELGEAVGVIAAQSIGEPGTQLTMRTFHTGGVAGKDIAGGLPRVVELFEARTPHGSARLAKASGVLRLGEDEGKGIPVIVVDDEGEEHEVVLPLGARPIVTDGQDIKAGDPITDGPFDPKEIMEIKGIRETQLYLVEEVQRVYRDQGVSIHDKHIELIVRQMTRRIGVQEPGDTGFLPGERVDSKVFRDTNRRMVEDGQAPRRGPPRDHGHHQGVAGHRVVAVGRLVPGDHPGAHRGRHRRPRRQPDRPQGEHHHRQAHPGRYRHDALPRVRHRSARLRADDVLLERLRGRGPGGVPGEPPRLVRRRPGRDRRRLNKSEAVRTGRRAARSLRVRVSESPVRVHRALSRQRSSR